MNYCRKCDVEIMPGETHCDTCLKHFVDSAMCWDDYDNDVEEYPEEL